MSVLRELFIFLRQQKKLWLVPIVLVMVIFGGLLLAAKGSVIAPLIYTVF